MVWQSLLRMCLLLCTVFLVGAAIACSVSTNGSPTPVPSATPGFTPVPIPTFPAPFPTPVPSPTPPPSPDMPPELRGQTAQETAQAIATFVSAGKEHVLVVENANISLSAVEYVLVDRQTGKIVSSNIEKLPGVVLRYTIRLTKTGVVLSPNNPDGLEILGAASDVLRFTADHIVDSRNRIPISGHHHR